MARSRCWPSKFHGKRLNSPNDVVVHRSGALVHRSAATASSALTRGSRASLELPESRLSRWTRTHQSGRRRRRTLHRRAEWPLLLARLHEALRRRHGASGAGTPQRHPGRWRWWVARAWAGRGWRPSRSEPSRAAPTASGATSATATSGQRGWAGAGYDGVHVIAPDGTESAKSAAGNLQRTSASAARSATGCS